MCFFVRRKFPMSHNTRFSISGKVNSPPGFRRKFHCIMCDSRVDAAWERGSIREPVLEWKLCYDCASKEPEDETEAVEIFGWVKPSDEFETFLDDLISVGSPQHKDWIKNKADSIAQRYIQNTIGTVSGPGL